MTHSNPPPILPVSYQLPTARSGGVGRSSWNPIAIAILILVGLPAMLWILPPIDFLMQTRSMAFGTASRAFTSHPSIAGVKVSFLIFWLFTLLRTCIDVALLVGVILGIMGRKIGRYVVYGGLAWIIFLSLANLIELHQRSPKMSIEDTANSLQSTVAVVAIGVVGCVILTRKI